MKYKIAIIFNAAIAKFYMRVNGNLVSKEHQSGFITTYSTLWFYTIDEALKYCDNKFGKANYEVKYE